MKSLLIVCAPVAALLCGSIAFTSEIPASQCISDYRISQLQVRHNISTELLERLRYYAESGQPQEGWQALSEVGDSYALTAKDLDTDVYAEKHGMFPKLLETHWKITTGRAAYEKYFYPLAYQHYRQYVEILETGYWPDSDQLINSYLAACRKFNLPETTAINAVWMSSTFSGFVRWEKAIGLTAQRIVPKSRACVTIGDGQATGIMLKDSFRTIFGELGSAFE